LDKIIKIDIPENKKIGVLLSGGMDSAILLFLMLKEIKDNNINVNLTAYNVPNVNDNASVHSKRIVEFLETYFQTDINFKSMGIGDETPLLLINKPAIELLTSGEVDVLFSGQNQFPPDAENWQAYKSALNKFVRRDPNVPETTRAKYPFIKLYKHHILEIYKQFNLLGLAKITHSCTTRLEGHCGECLWCEERAWAFNKLGLVDTAI
jgi:7-cyano-7-deazaguanine synthase in queuosine biosynthesis